MVKIIYNNFTYTNNYKFVICLMTNRIFSVLYSQQTALYPDLEVCVPNGQSISSRRALQLNLLPSRRALQLNFFSAYCRAATMAATSNIGCAVRCSYKLYLHGAWAVQASLRCALLSKLSLHCHTGQLHTLDIA